MCELAGTSALFVSVLSTVQSLGADDVICFAMVFFGGGSDRGFEWLTCGCRNTFSFLEMRTFGGCPTGVETSIFVSCFAQLSVSLCLVRAEKRGEDTNKNNLRPATMVM